MSATYFDAPRTAQALLSQLAGWFGVRQSWRSDAPSKSARVVPLSAPTARACHSCGAGTPHCGPTSEAPGPDAASCDIAALLKAEQQRGRDMEKALSHYVSPQVLDRLMSDPEGLSRSAETRDVTVLFADLQGFTSLAEALKDDPGRLADLISAFLDPMTDIVLAHGGTIDKYMGDCVMAFWGAPVVDAQHPRRALEAARAMIGAMDEVNRRFRDALANHPAAPAIEIGISIGLNSGDCVVGNVGSRRRFDYSVLGDPVNVASRLEGLCKDYDTSLLVGEGTARRVGPEAGLRQLDHIRVRGRAQRLSVFGCVSDATPTEMAA